MISVDHFVEQAHALHKQGFHIFPADHPDQPDCIGKHGPNTPCDGKRGKHPAVKWGTWAVTVTPQMIDLAWSERGGLANIAIACGPSSLVVLDEDEWGELERWCADFGITLPETYTVTTGRGRHLVFRWDHRTQRIGNHEKPFKGYKINVRGDGGYIIAEGSQHESGAIYAGDGVPIADLPQEVADLLLAGAAPKETNGQAKGQTNGQSFWEPGGNPNSTIIRDGQRHNALIAYAGRLRKSGLDYHEAEPTFHARWLLCEQPEGQVPEARFHSLGCRYPVTWEEAAGKLADVFVRYPAGAGPTTDTGDGGGGATHLRDRMFSLSGLAHLPPVKPLIDGLLYRDTLAQLCGPPGCYKSFATIGMACSVALGVPFAGSNVPQAGRVVYVAAEGASGLRARVLAWCEEEGVDPEALDGQLLILPEPVQLGTASDVAQVVDVVGEFHAAMVAFDTRARCTVGLEENSATEQGKAIDAAERIRAAVGCTVMAVHHSARAGTTGRGSSAWDGAVWSDLRMEGEGLRAKITCAKHKEVPDGCEHHLVLRPHVVARELMPDTLLEDQRRTLAISRNPLGISEARANSRIVVLEIVRNSAPPEGFTAKQVVDAAAEARVSQSSVYSALKSLLDDGDLINVGTDKRTRYVAKVVRP